MRFQTICNFSSSLYPLHLSPNKWSSCEDKNEALWNSWYSTKQPRHYQINQLVKSSGFCPQNRCQLYNVTAPILDKQMDYVECPQGLCYDRKLRGIDIGTSCCYTKGYFSSGRLIGYQNKSRSQKPIYTASRVTIGRTNIIGVNNDPSFESFIDANYVHERLIATQCPLLQTINNVKQMIVEQNIRMWIQLAPSIGGDHNCESFPLVFLNNLNCEQCNAGVSNFIIHSNFSNGENRMIRITFTLTGYVHRIDNSRIHTIFNNEDMLYSSKNDNVLRIDVPVEYIWYRSWKDMSVPSATDNESLLNVASQAASFMENNKTVAINCMSGRGRTGTFAALILAKLYKIKTSNELISIIVSMREKRDNMVEIPEQYEYLVGILGVQNDVIINQQQLGAKITLFVCLMVLLYFLIYCCVQCYRKSTNSNCNFSLLSLLNRKYTKLEEPRDS
eukprot:gene11307-15168_t